MSKKRGPKKRATKPTIKIVVAWDKKGRYAVGGDSEKAEDGELDLVGADLMSDLEDDGEVAVYEIDLNTLTLKVQTRAVFSDEPTPFDDGEDPDCYYGDCEHTDEPCASRKSPPPPRDSQTGTPGRTPT
jgi:hypothetical protein